MKSSTLKIAFYSFAFLMLGALLLISRDAGISGDERYTTNIRKKYMIILQPLVKTRMPYTHRKPTCNTMGSRLIILQRS